MEFGIELVDVSEYLAAQQRPVCLFERQLLHGDSPSGGIFLSAEVARVGKFWVPEGDLFTVPKWGFTNRGQYVRVPMTAYRASARSLPVLFCLGVQVGMVAVASLQRDYGVQVKAAQLFLGNECTDLVNEDAIRAYIGIAICGDE